MICVTYNGEGGQSCKSEAVELTAEATNGADEDIAGICSGGSAAEVAMTAMIMIDTKNILVRMTLTLGYHL